MVKNGKENKYRSVHRLGLLTTIPAVLLSGPLIGFFVGNYLDRRYGTSPWFMALLLIIGSIGSIRQTIRIILRAGGKE